MTEATRTKTGKRRRREDVSAVRVGSWWRCDVKGRESIARRIKAIEQEGLATIIRFEDGGKRCSLAGLLAQYRPCEAPAAEPTLMGPTTPERDLLALLVEMLKPEIRKAVREGIDDAFNHGEGA